MQKVIKQSSIRRFFETHALACHHSSSPASAAFKGAPSGSSPTSRCRAAGVITIDAADKGARSSGSATFQYSVVALGIPGYMDRFRSRIGKGIPAARAEWRVKLREVMSGHARGSAHVMSSHHFPYESRVRKSPSSAHKQSYG